MSDAILAARIPELLPRAIAWAEEEERLALLNGNPLKADLLTVARGAGVRSPETIRIVVVDSSPMPKDPELKAIALQSGLLGPVMLGLTLGYGVLVRRGHEANVRLLSHEFRHVYQYENAGSIAKFLPVYLAQIAQFGYHTAPLEVDARAHEVDAADPQR